ncbi:MAG: oxygen-independent coproporphyrinogen III oxidase [Bacteroidota bacterium]
MCNLTQKYNVPGPRYTSYPTVPYWDVDKFSSQKWKESVANSFAESKGAGISLYIHLPFCESMCTFCGCHKRITKRHEVEAPYINSVLKEWYLYCDLLEAKPTIKELHLGGGTPTFFSPQNLIRLVEGILKNAYLDKEAQLSFEGHPNNTTADHLNALYGVGFSRVCFGVQDYNPNVQFAINRIQSFEKVAEITAISRKIGYTSVGHDLVYGLPFQTIRDVEETLARTAQIMPDRIAFYSYAHVPWKKGNGQRGYRDEDLPSARHKISQYKVGKLVLSEMGYKDIGMDHFALPSDALFKAVQKGSLHRNFMGYTPSNTRLIIGLGASSISDSWSAFAQNVKNIEEYQHLVAQNCIPVFRGHLLNKEDQLIRRHILNLMCRFTTSWSEDQVNFLNFEQIKCALKEFEYDGLIEINGNHVVVTQKGKPFIRNIGMAFDLRLQRKQPETQMFSMTV